MLGPAVNRGDGEHAEGLGIEFAADDRLEREDARGRQEDRVHRLIRVGRVAAEATDQEIDRLRSRRGRPLGEEDGTLRLPGRDVEGEREVGPADAVVEPVGDHRGGPRDPLLGGLADQDEPPAPGAAERPHGPGQADETRHVKVVTAGVHDRDGSTAGGRAGGAARVREPGRLLDRERVHVGPDEERRARPLIEDGRDAVAPDPVVNLEAGPFERCREPLGRLRLLPRELGVLVEGVVKKDEVVVDRTGHGAREEGVHRVYVAP